jgi:putative membrane protein
MDTAQFVDTLVSGFINKHMAKPVAPAAPSNRERSLVKGILAGLAAGIVATAAKTVAEKIYPPRTHGEPEPPVVLADKVTGHSLAPATKAVAAETIHWGFGMVTGAAYGALAEFYPAATSREGVNFGMTLMALTHETALPAMGLSAPTSAQTTREKTSEMASHIIFGLVTETVRKTVRKLI